jgi:hypothetical protein
VDKDEPRALDQRDCSDLAGVVGAGLAGG